MNRALRRILKKAGTERLMHPKQKPDRVFPESVPESYAVFKKLVPFTGFWPIISIIVIPVLIGLGFLISELRQTIIYILPSYLAVVAIYLLMNQFRYRVFYRGWTGRLPFALTGWNELIRRKKMFCDLCWNDIRIDVEFEPQNETNKRLVNAALQILSKRAKKAFYRRKIGATGSDRRKDWKTDGTGSATGSANPQVMAYIKRTLENELSTIAKQTGCITSVNITVCSEEWQELIQIDTGNT